MRQMHLCRQKKLYRQLLPVMSLSSVLTVSHQLIVMEMQRTCLSVKIAMPAVSTFNILSVCFDILILFLCLLTSFSWFSVITVLKYFCFADKRLASYYLLLNGTLPNTGNLCLNYMCMV